MTDRRFGHAFRDPTLLTQALTHRSFGPAAGEPATEGERLEFLGDAVLGFVVAEWLFQRLPGAREGELTRRKQDVVRRQTLEGVARRLDLGAELRLGPGEEATGGREKPSLLADAFEAVLGAVYLDAGMRAARAFVLRHLGEELRASLEGTALDAKTALQEHAQLRWHRTPTYRIVRAAGPAHAPAFTSEVLVGERVLGIGQGTTRKQAEQEAARAALLRVREAE
ncbi:MAG TPA: ribonuclease III [Candidatus Polarisedimenticolaceae bacterium]|nr:ribonuclease III [Candidatus Polarisedimenticolaceae bacterium]